MRPAVTVVIPCRDRASLLEGCLARLMPTLAAGDEVIVVDSASRDDSVADVARRFGVRLVRCARPGASHARNAGWQAATSDVILFTDDDMRPEPGWVDALAQAATGPDLGFVVGHTTAAPTADRQATVTVTIGRPPDVIRYGAPGVVGGSNNLAVPAPVLREVGGFDERLGPGTWFAAGEDLDLMDRVLATGRVGRYAPSARSTHVPWRTRREGWELQWHYGKGMGARIAALAHRDRATARALWNEILRVEGVRTLALRSTRRGRVTGTDDAAPSRVVGPMLWRCGAVAGLVVGLARLPAPPPRDEHEQPHRTDR